MKLHIENFAKISSADILFDGLTVIAGDNNTGKSTVGKILYAFYRSLSNHDSRIRKERKDALAKKISESLDTRKFGPIEGLIEDGLSVRDIVTRVLESFWAEGDKMGMPHPSAEQKQATISAYVEKIKPGYDQALRADDSEYAATIVGRVFDCVFHHQFHPLQPNEGRARLVLTIKGKDNVFEFSHLSGSCLNPTRFMNKAWYVATPDILSQVNVKRFGEGEDDHRYFDKYSFELIRELRGPGRELNSVEKRKIAEILSRLDSVIGGVFRADEQDQHDLSLFEAGHNHPTKAENLSMGLKMFVLLRYMLEHGILSERDVLVLDEPENHLHPSWQVAFAQIVVLLKRELDLTVLVTSHSQFFVNALQRFSISEGIAKHTNFYLSRYDEKHQGFCTFEHKGRFAGQIMRSFGRAYDLMGDLSGETADEAVEDPADVRRD